jgi:phage shock protein PspC (stress-responsive transcriptional regulator)
MKKTLTINLFGIVFNIDEDAYEVLQQYLHKLETRFSDEDEKEIMCDIEARLAELFNDALKSGNKNVVTICDVNSVIKQLGTAEEIESEDDNYVHEESKAENAESRRRHRKFYRDADNKILGGVAAGLAAYLGLEVTITRLILVLLAITILGWLIPIYLLVWLIAPEATTTAQKLEMQGIEPSIENIKSYVNSEQFRESASRIGSRLGEIVKWLFRIAAIIVGLFFAFIGVIVIGALTIALIGIITGMGGVIFGGLLPLANPNTSLITFIVATLVALLIPIVSIIMATIRLIRRDNTPHKTGWGWLWFIIWIIASIISINTLLVSIPNLVNTLENLDENGFIALFDNNTTTEERLRGETFNAIDIDNALVVQLVKDTCSFVEVKGSTTTLRNTSASIDNNTLKLKRQGIIDTHNGQHIIVHYCAEINKIEMSSASVLSNENECIDSRHLEIEAESAAVLNIGVNCENLNIDAESAAVINIWGKTNSLTADIASAAVVNFKDLTTDIANIDADIAAVIDAPKTENLNLKKQNSTNTNQ